MKPYSRMEDLKIGDLVLIESSDLYELHLILNKYIDNKATIRASCLTVVSSFDKRDIGQTHSYRSYDDWCAWDRYVISAEPE